MISKSDSEYLFLIYWDSDPSEVYKMYYGSIEDTKKIGIEWYDVVDDISGYFMSRPLKIGSYLIVVIDLYHTDVPNQFKKYKRDLTISKIIN